MTSDITSGTPGGRPARPVPAEAPQAPQAPQAPESPVAPEPDSEAGTRPAHEPPTLAALPRVPGVHHRFVDAGGVRLHVAEAGRGEPVLLLHGFPQHWYAWRGIVPLLAGRYRLICLDLRGFGWSEAPARGYDTATRVADVLAVMDALEIPRARLIGHEFGAWTGFMACLRAPERFSHFLALNAVHPWPRHRRLLPQAWRYWYTTPLELPFSGRTVLRRLPGFTRFLLRRGMAGQGPWDDARAMEEFVRSSAEPRRARAAEAMHRQYAMRDIAGLVLGSSRSVPLTCGPPPGAVAGSAGSGRAAPGRAPPGRGRVT